VAPGFMYHFPWESVGNYKYALFLPFAYVLATGQDDADDWCYHMLSIVFLRYLQVCLVRSCHPPNPPTPPTPPPIFHPLCTSPCVCTLQV
jgi:hypothetical protein